MTINNLSIKRSDINEQWAHSGIVEAGCMMDWIKKAMSLNTVTFQKAECAICQTLMALLIRRLALPSSKYFCH